MLKYLLIIILIAIPSLSSAGVTIHYAGEVSKASKVKQVLKSAEKYAAQRKWKVEPLTDGIKIHAHEWCEPINLVFKGTILSEDFVKTQFAGPEVHEKVIGLFQIIKPFMAKLEIEDEGEFWETGDFIRLKANIDKTNEMMKKHKAENPKLQGPRKLPNGLIVDLLE